MARGLCPSCGRNHYVQPKTGMIGEHSAKGPTGYSLGYQCDGVGKSPQPTTNPNLVGYTEARDSR